MATNQRAPLLAATLLLTLVKSIQFAIDSQALFYYDSGAFILNGLGLAFLPERAYVYGGLIRAFAVPFHSLRAIVAMQVVMGGLTGWLLTFALLRFLHVRAWIAVLAALVFAFDPVQIVYEHLVMSETTALLAMAVFLLAALRYLRGPSLWWLVILSFLGVLLVSLRFVYLPLVLAAAVLLPLAAYFSFSARRRRLLALALVVSCGSTVLFQMGYRDLTGWLAGREPAYHYSTGFFLLASIAPIVESGDSGDVRVAGAVAAQNQSGLPLFDRAVRWRQLWTAEGLVPRLRTVFHGDERAADQAAQRLARAAIQRNPLGFVKLGLHNYLDYWTGIRSLRAILTQETGAHLPPAVTLHDASVISSVFGADVSHQHTLNTPSRRYHIFARAWYLFLLAAPFLAGLGLWLRPANPKGVALLFFWSCLLLAATCLGGIQASYRYVHPFSFMSLAAAAVLCETLIGRQGKRG